MAHITGDELYEMYGVGAAEVVELHEHTGNWAKASAQSTAWNAYRTALDAASPQAQNRLDSLIGRHEDMPESFRRAVYPLEAARRAIAGLFNRRGA